MSYIEKEPIIEFITNGLNNPDKTKAFGYDAIEILTEIEYAPTADVVPKSEVEKEIKNWQELYADTVSKWEKAYEELEIKLEKAKSEVAREIFEEFESILDAMIQLNHAIGVQQEDPIEREKAISAEQALRAFCDYVAELKKKYTEVSTNEV